MIGRTTYLTMLIERLRLAPFEAAEPPITPLWWLVLFAGSAAPLLVGFLYVRLQIGYNEVAIRIARLLNPRWRLRGLWLRKRGWVSTATAMET